ncbi:MAG: hypothetical protein LDL41_03055 [Coleofasciculus sp. S288]|nr:hypothetical protein [Coleofasciculus sp. S288]
MPSVTLGLFAMMLGVTGELKTAQADELPEEQLPIDRLQIADSQTLPIGKLKIADSQALQADKLQLIAASEFKFSSLDRREDTGTRGWEENECGRDECNLVSTETGVTEATTAPDIELEENREVPDPVETSQQDISTSPVPQLESASPITDEIEEPSETSTETVAQENTSPTEPSEDILLEPLSSSDQTTAQIEITSVGDPRVPADGRSTLTLEGRITDETGELITEDVVVTLTASAGKFVGADQDEDRLGFQVIARGGQFTAQLQSGLEAQKVRIRAAVEGTRLRREASTVSSAARLRLRRTSEPRSAERDWKLETEEDLNTDEPSESNFTAPQQSGSPTSLLEAYTQVEFITNLRSPLVSGVFSIRIGQSGTDFWGSRRNFLDPDLIDDGTEFDIDGAIFATGRIGEWLFTGAYNSDRPLNETCDGTTRLFRGPQFCEQNYPVYGDSSTVDYLTPSTDSVYLRFERTSPVPGAEPDYAMWGDYSTTEFARTSQLFTATTRQLHGFKGNYNLGNLQFSAFYSRDIEGFQRDIIAPNGTSGYYFLSRRLLVEGSENVFLETEELNRPGTVIERKPLYRGSDYEIDYDRGSLLFRRPILATELGIFENSDRPREGEPPSIADISPSTLLVRRIVVTYQYENEGGNDTSVYAGRLQYNFSQEFDSESWIAATYLREDEGMQDFELYGADFLVRLGDNGELIGEYAHSSYESLFRNDISGSAYRLELTGKITSSLSGRAYYRSVDEGFTNYATTSLTAGQTRYGAAIAYELSSTTSLQAGYDFEENFGIAPAVRTDFFDLFNPGVDPRPGDRVDNTLRTIRAGIRQEIGDATLGVDYVNRSREDRVSDTFDGDASQIVSHLALPFTETLTFRAQNELNLGDSDPLYPNRTTFGLDWAVYPGVTLRLAHQFFDGGILGDDSLTSFDTIVEHHLGENTTIRGRYSVIGGFNGITGQGAVGLNHVWAIAPGLRLNLGYEHTFSNTSIATAAGERFAQPYAVGQSASSLALLGGDVYTVGIEYTDNPDFKASARFEHRTGSGNDNTVFTIAAGGKLSPALTILGRYQQANFANQSIEGLDDSATLKLGLAYRDPNSDRWNALFRYEYRKNPSTIPETILFGSGRDSNEHLFSLEAIYAPSWRWEFYGKGAFRHSNTDLADDFSNSSTIFLSQLRASYRLGYRMDLAVEGRWIGQSEPDYDEFGFALETGYYLTPDLRVAVGYSFGSVDDRDFSGYRSEGGIYFGLTFKVNELFGGFGRQRVVPPQQQESLVEGARNGELETRDVSTPASEFGLFSPQPFPHLSETTDAVGTTSSDE